MKTKWISVEERLPDYGEKVLVVGERMKASPSMGGASITIAERQDLSNSLIKKDAHRYQDKNQFSQMSYVTYWMPLPKLPEK